MTSQESSGVLSLIGLKPRQVFLIKENLPVYGATGQIFACLVKFTLVKSHSLESLPASFVTSLTNENLACVHTGESRREARREKLARVYGAAYLTL